MKNRIIPPFLFTLTLLVVSCTAVDNSNRPEASLEKKKDVTPSKSRKGSKSSVINKHSNENSHKAPALSSRANDISDYAIQKGYSTKYCFLIDMSIPSGRDRFFVYDLENKTVASGLVAHGCCNETFISHPKFSNSSSSG